MLLLTGPNVKGQIRKEWDRYNQLRFQLLILIKTISAFPVHFEAPPRSYHPNSALFPVMQKLNNNYTFMLKIKVCELYKLVAHNRIVVNLSRIKKNTSLFFISRYFV